jgi:hypothetical protein
MAREEGFFDELARGLADGSLTRGKALRLMGAALLGGTLGSLGIREASADRPGCKRAGKHCTRTDQCCGDLVCLSGTCQTPTTTTTETPTTTTTETPTTTTTETPTTTTTETPTTTTTETPTTTTTETPTTTTTETPTTTTSTTTCSGLPNGAPCTASGTPCCSGNCESGFCLPPTGGTRADCRCAGGAIFTPCTSVPCGPMIEVLVCDPLCGGNTSLTACRPDATCAG